MNNYTILFFGWCQQENHDKVWGWVSVGSDKMLYNFWGRRGKNFSFKRYNEKWDTRPVRSLIAKKTELGRANGTYVPVDPRLIETIVPGFSDEFQNQFVMAKLFHKFHGETIADA